MTAQEPGQVPSGTGSADPSGTDRSGPGRRAQPVPEFVEYRSSHAWRYLIAAAFVLLCVLAVVATLAALGRPSGRGFALALVLAAAAGLSWWALLNWAPRVVSIGNGFLMVARGDQATRIDLRTQADRIDLGSDPGSPSWRAVIRRPRGQRAVINAKQVEPAEFTRIVRHYIDQVDRQD